jgi:hypothetical protein
MLASSSDFENNYFTQFNHHHKMFVILHFYVNFKLYRGNPSIELHPITILSHQTISYNLTIIDKLIIHQHKKLHLKEKLFTKFLNTSTYVIGAI